jgi:membrane fusion protein, adhesin transport system
MPSSQALKLAPAANASAGPKPLGKGPAPVYELPAVHSVQTPRLVRSVARLFAVLLVVSIVTLIFVPWQQNISGAGRVTAYNPIDRQQTIDTPVDGRIVKWYVVEGARVKKGDPIVELADIDPNLPFRLRAERDAAVERIRAANDRQSQIDGRIFELEQQLKNEIVAADFRISQASDRVRAAEQSLEAAEARDLAARLNFERHTSLFPKGLVSKRQLEIAEAERNTVAAELERAKAQLNESLNFRRTAEAERLRTINGSTAAIRDAKASRESARSEIAMAQQSLQPIEVRLNRQATQVVRAPADGTIFRLTQQPNSAVLKSGDEIASFVPDNSEPVVELLVAGNDMPLISKDRPVRLQFEGWPAIQFVGWPSVAVGTFGGVVTLVDPTDNGSGKFRLLVSPDPKDQPWPSTAFLRQGVRTKGWVLLNNVPLGFELWRQFNGFPPTVSNTAPDTGKTEAKGKK